MVFRLNQVLNEKLKNNPDESALDHADYNAVTGS
jgi:hypothetical protein